MIKLRPACCRSNCRSRRGSRWTGACPSRRGPSMLDSSKFPEFLSSSTKMGPRVPQGSLEVPRNLLKKWTTRCNFINILCANFLNESALRFSLVAFWLCNFLEQKYWKVASKMLKKLTTTAPGVNYIPKLKVQIFCALVFFKSSFYFLRVWLCNFLAKEYRRKSFS